MGTFYSSTLWNSSFTLPLDFRNVDIWLTELTYVIPDQFPMGSSQQTNHFRTDADVMIAEGPDRAAEPLVPLWRSAATGRLSHL